MLLSLMCLVIKRSVLAFQRNITITEIAKALHPLLSNRKHRPPSHGSDQRQSFPGSVHQTEAVSSIPICQDDNRKCPLVVVEQWHRGFESLDHYILPLYGSQAVWEVPSLVEVSRDGFSPLFVFFGVAMYSSTRPFHISLATSPTMLHTVEYGKNPQIRGLWVQAFHKRLQDAPVLKGGGYDEMNQIIQCRRQPPDQLLDRGEDTPSDSTKQNDRKKHLEI